MGTSKTAKQKYDYLSAVFNMAIERDISLDEEALKLDFMSRFFSNENTAKQYINMFINV